MQCSIRGDKLSFCYCLTWYKDCNKSRIDLEQMLFWVSIMEYVEFKPDVLYSTKKRLITESMDELFQDREYIVLFNDLKSNKDNISNKFAENIRRRTNKIIEHTSEFHIIKFINARFDIFDFQTAFSILGVNLEITEWKSIRDYDLNKAFGEVDHSRAGRNYKNPIIDVHDIGGKIKYIPNTNFTPVKITTSSFNIYEANEKANRAFTLLRMVLNLEKSFSTILKMAAAGRNNLPLSEFMPSPISIVFNDRKEFTQLFFADLPYEYSFVTNLYMNFGYLASERQRQKGKFINRIHELIDIINTSDTIKINRFIVNVLLSYQDALDGISETDSFMSFWRIIEIICLDDPSKENKTKRMKILLGFDSNSMTRIGIESINEFRNKFVHYGKFNNDGDILFVVKGIIDQAIVNLIILSRNIKSETELLLFYQMSTLGNQDLESRKNVIDFIEKSRISNKL